MTICALRFLAPERSMPACAGRIHMHHVLNKSFLKGNAQALALVEGKYKHLFMVEVCEKHNVDRYADTKVARAYLLLLQPREIVEPALEEIANLYTGGYPEMSWEALTWPYFKWLKEKTDAAPASA